MQDLETEYRASIQRADAAALSLGCWLPTLGRRLRPIVPGELLFLLADTGVGKSAALQSIARCARGHIVLFVEMELPGPLLFERWVAQEQRRPAGEIENMYRNGKSALLVNLLHIWTCQRTRRTVRDIHWMIEEMATMPCGKPDVVCVDYLGLMGNKAARSPYEAMTQQAQDLKAMAKTDNVVVLAATQRHRKENSDGTTKVTLHDARDSGCIEESAGIVIGLWRDKSRPATGAFVQILKSTKDGISDAIHCEVNGPSLLIEESAHIGEEPGMPAAFAAEGMDG